MSYDFLNKPWWWKLDELIKEAIEIIESVKIDDEIINKKLAKAIDLLEKSLKINR